MKSIVLEIEPADMAVFKSVIESYDNLATLRTEDPRRHLLKMWFDPALEDDVDRLLDSLAPKVRLKRVS
jgi:Domain of unknown function (DUF4911)